MRATRRGSWLVSLIVLVSSSSLPPGLSNPRSPTSGPQPLVPDAEAAQSEGTLRRLQTSETNQSGSGATASSSGRRQQVSLGASFASGTLTTSRFKLTSGFFASTFGAPKTAVPLSELDIKVLYAKTEPLGVKIPEKTWQRDADPIFLWEAPSAGLDIAGYSYAVDTEPDDTIDTTSTSWDVAQDPTRRLPDGQHAFQVKAINTAKNAGKAASVTLWIDTVPPVIGGFSPSPGSMLNSRAQTITASVTDAGSGITSETVELLVNGSRASVTVGNGTVSARGVGLLREGPNSIELRAADLVGNAQPPQVWSVTLDATPPSGSVLINGGASMSTSVYVTLNVTASDAVSGVKRMLISNDPLIGYVDEPFAAVRELWRLNAVRGPQRVYVKFADGAGNVSEPVSDEIDLGLLAPDTIIVSGPAGVTPQRTASFEYSCPEGGCVFSYAFDNDDWSPWSTDTQATRENLVFGNHYFKVKAAKESNGLDGIQPDEEDPIPAERTWIVGVEPTQMLFPRGSPIKLWRLE